MNEETSSRGKKDEVRTRVESKARARESWGGHVSHATTARRDFGGETEALAARRSETPVFLEPALSARFSGSDSKVIE